MDDSTLPLLGYIAEVREQHFRVARASAGRYGVARVSDNVRLGTYAVSDGSLHIEVEEGDLATLAEVAAAAIRKGLR